MRDFTKFQVEKDLIRNLPINGIPVRLHLVVNPEMMQSRIKKSRLNKLDRIRKGKLLNFCRAILAQFVDFNVGETWV